MKTFNYRAINQIGQQEKGRMEAVSIADLEVRLQQLGLDLTTAKVVTHTQSRFIRGKVSQRDLIMFCFQLEQLIHAGVPILEALSDLKESASSTEFKTILGAIVSSVEGGKMLSEALSSHPTVFDAVFVNLVAAGEQSGELPTVLNQLSHTLKWQDELFAQTKRLLTYPLFILVAVMSAIVFLMVFLVPELVKFVGELGQALPWSTRLLIFVSNAFVHYWWLLIMLPIFVVLAFTAWVKISADARYQLDRLQLKLPMVGNVLDKIIMARFSRYFALLYRAGIPILAAIKTCENIVGNQVVASALNDIHDSISAGNSMSDGFRQTGLFPSLVIRMISVGERSGELDQSLMNVSYFYDRDVDVLLQSMLKMLEPVLTVILGLVLMFVMTAVLGPVYDSFSQMPL